MIKVLDHGYVRFIESWGSDRAIIEAARMSTQKGFAGWGPQDDGSPGDERLLRYLYRNNHATPFEFAGMVIEVQAPLCVFREWHRHRAAGYNEASARYAPLPALDYVPTIERCLAGGGHLTKQAGAVDGAAELTAEAAGSWIEDLCKVYDRAEAVYQRGLKLGVPKEIARLSMTVGRYSRMRATTNLRMWLHFLGLRSAPNAQWEIRQYAEVVAGMVRAQFPRTYELYASR